MRKLGGETVMGAVLVLIILVFSTLGRCDQRAFGQVLPCEACEGFDENVVVFRDEVRWCWPDAGAEEYEVEVETWLGGSFVASSFEIVPSCRIALPLPVPLQARARHRALGSQSWSRWSAWGRRAPPFDADANGIINGYDFIPFRYELREGRYQLRDFVHFRNAYVLGVPPPEVVVDPPN